MSSSPWACRLVIGRYSRTLGNKVSAASGRWSSRSMYVHPVDSVKVVSVRPDRRWQRRPQCGVCRQRAPLYDRGHRRRWRSLDDGLLRVHLEADVPRVRCAEHGVVTAAVPRARHRAGHTVAFDETVTWMATGTCEDASNACRDQARPIPAPAPPANEGNTLALA